MCESNPGFSNRDKKALLRKEVLKHIKTFKNKKEESEVIFKKINRLFDFSSYDKVLIFYPMKSEPDITPLLALENTALPFIENGEMFFSSDKNLSKGPMGFKEPKHDAVEFNHALMIVPLIAFDNNNYRLGRGGGFYDRFIEKYRDKLYTVGIAYSVSKVDSVFPESFDQKLDLIISGDSSL